MSTASGTIREIVTGITVAPRETRLLDAVALVLAVKDLIDNAEVEHAVQLQSLLKAGQPVTAAQEAELLDTFSQVQEDAEERIANVLDRCGTDTTTSEHEHPTYTRARWPRKGEAGVTDISYWLWVLQRIETNGGLEEHCDECCAQLDGNGWNGKCGDCADAAESERG